MIRKTKEDFENLTNKKYSIKGELKNFSTKTLIKCNTCGYEWEAKPETLTRKHNPVNCPRCPLESKLKEVCNTKEIYTITNYRTVHDICEWHCKKCGNVWKTKLSNVIYNGTGCPSCVNASKKKTTQWFKNEVLKLEGSNYSVLGEYVDYETHILLRHEICGTEYLTTPNNFLGSINKNGRRCPKCSHWSKLKTTEEYIRDLEIFRPGEFEVLGKYTGNKKTITLKCKKCNKIFEAWPSNILYLNSQCPSCMSSSSRFQKEMLNFIESLYDDNSIVKSNYKMKNKKEIDVFISSKNIGFEYDGLYWHSEAVAGKKNLLEKTISAEKEGINIFHIYDDEWQLKKDIVKSKIKAILGKKENLEKIYARKCIVREINAKLKNNFLESNHIQGKDSSTIKLGLFNNESLVAVMTFTKPRLGMGQNKKNGTIELSRFATDINKNVIGGFGKLLKYFENNFGNDFKYIMSYADLRYSSKGSNIYLKNNFKQVIVNPPSYDYYYQLKRYHRFTFRKAKIKELFPDIYDPKLTEFQMMDKTKYRRIWDCGTITYEKEINSKN